MPHLGVPELIILALLFSPLLVVFFVVRWILRQRKK
jgi:hypothetical protein